MTQNNSQTSYEKLILKKRRGVAEVISTLLLVAITVVGAVILTGFLDETFVSGSQSVISGTDTTIKTIKLRGYDTRNGETLMGSTDYNLDNINVPTVDDVLCRASCGGDTTPTNGGSDFIIIQVENRGFKSIYVKNVYLDNVGHPWDADTFNVLLNSGSADSSGGVYPSNGRFSVLSTDITDRLQRSNEINGGETVNLLLKLDTTNSDIELSKSVRVEVNLGERTLSSFLIETGDAR